MIAHIGCGYWGKNIARTLQRHNILSAVYDFDDSVNNNFCEEFNFDNHSLEKILNNKQIKGCSLATPADSHYELSKRILDSGKHLFVEKPICLSIDHARELKDLSSSKNLVVMVGHLMHYHSGFVKMKNLIEEGSFGAIRRIKSYRKSFGIIRDSEDVIWSFAPHDISMVFALMDCYQAKNLNLTRKKFFNENTDSALITFYCDDVPIEIDLDWSSSYKQQRLEVYCEKGMLILDDTNEKGNKLLESRQAFNYSDLKQKSSPEYNSVKYSDELLPLDAEMLAFKESIQYNNFNFKNNIDEAISVLKVLTTLSKL